MANSGGPAASIPLSLATESLLPGVRLWGESGGLPALSLWPARFLNLWPQGRPEDSGKK